jgi:hypothetical protein
VAQHGLRKHHPRGLWSARCSGTGTAGAEGGPGKRADRKASTAPRADPTAHGRKPEPRGCRSCRTPSCPSGSPRPSSPRNGRGFPRCPRWCCSRRSRI